VHISDAEFDELLTAALYRAAEFDEMDTPSDEELEELVQPSLLLQRKMNRLLRNPRAYVRKQRRPISVNIIRIAAAFIVLFTVLLGAAMAVSPTVRATVVNLIRSWLYDRTIYQVPPHNLVLAREWTFEYIPDGFELIEQRATEHHRLFVWENYDPTEILITITTGNLIVGSEHSDIYTTVINGKVTDVYVSNDIEYGNTIVMHDNVNEVLVSLASYIDLDELIKIAEGIR
jgi:hypothetical protein